MSFTDSVDVSDADSPSSSGTQPMSISTPSPGDSDKSLSDNQTQGNTENTPTHSENSAGLSQHGKFKIEPDPESCVSDVSEMADPVKEHLANVQIIRKEDLEAGNTMCQPDFVVQQRIVRQPDETDEEFAKRLRKINYLSLAQEFAELKKTDSEALPFDLHKANPYNVASPGSDISTDIDSACQSEAATPCENSKPFPATMATESVATACSTAGLATRLDSLKVSSRSEPAVASSSKLNSHSEQSHTKQDEHNSNNSNSQITSDDISDNKSIPENNTLHSKHDKNNTKLRSAPKTDRRGKTQSTIVTRPSGKKSASPHRKSVPAADKLDDFDVYNIETALPQMDWAALEKQLKKAAEEEKAKLVSLSFTCLSRF